MITFSYCLDAAGNLIRLELGQHQDALIPGAAELTTAASELRHSLPWTKTVADAVNDIRFVPRPHVVGTDALKVHESRNIPQSPYVFVPRSIDYAADDQVMDMIGLFDELPAESEGRQHILIALSTVGVQQIPYIAKFVPQLHTGTTGGAISQYLRPGWISYSKVYRKVTLA